MTNTTKADQTQEQKPLISAAERRRRQDAVNFARASVGLEGFKPSAECEADTVRYINGEIEIADGIAAINEWARANT